MSRYAIFAIVIATLSLVAAASARAEESCGNNGTVMSQDAMKKSLQDRGYIKIRSLTMHNGCYEAKGFDRNGHRFELEVNAASGAIVNAE